MSEGILVKKRGRPRKSLVVDIVSPSGAQTESSKLSKPKRQSSAAQSDGSKKLARTGKGSKKPEAFQQDVEAVKMSNPTTVRAKTREAPNTKSTAKNLQSTRPTSGQSQSLSQKAESSQLDQFVTKATGSIDVVGSARADTALAASVEHESLMAASEVEQRPEAGTLRPRRQDSANSYPTEAKTKPLLAQSPIVSDIKVGHQSRTTFLSGFLDEKYQEPAPQAAEGDIIPGYEKPEVEQPSIDEIVKGSGVSLHSAHSQPSPRNQQGDSVNQLEPSPPSSILTAVHAFQPRSSSGANSSLAEVMATASTVRTTPLNIYSASPFSKFRGGSPAQEARAMPNPSTRPVSPTTYSTSSFMRFRQSKARLAPSKPARARTRKAKPAQTPPTTLPVPMGRPSPPSSSSPRPPQFRAPTAQLPNFTGLRAAAEASAVLQAPKPRRPTEMSLKELKKDPKFRELSRRWTGLIVGIPVLIMTSWVIGKRYLQQREERALARLQTASESVSVSANGQNDATNGTM